MIMSQKSLMKKFYLFNDKGKIIRVLVKIFYVPYSTVMDPALDFALY